MNDYFDFIEQLIKRILTLDPAMLIFVFCIALGYILKSLPKFPNEKIPYVCMGLPPLVYPLMVWSGWDVKKVTSDVVTAVVFSGLAWAAHRFIFKKLIDSKVFPADGPEGTPETKQAP